MNSCIICFDDTTHIVLLALMHYVYWFHGTNKSTTNRDADSKTATNIEQHCLFDVQGTHARTAEYQIMQGARSHIYVCVHMMNAGLVARSALCFSINRYSIESSQLAHGSRWELAKLKIYKCRGHPREKK